ncbi:hypothetical protein TNCV_1657171 [Trichonephila clavipes]|nr:hypothetical protein TNCV_1657171 [Trichonephila clavipes]
MTAQRHVHDILQPMWCPSCNGSPRSHFSTRQCSASHGKTVSALLLPFLGLPIPTTSWAPHELERTRGKVTATMERNVSRHHTDFVCPIVSLHRVLALEDVQQCVKSSVL